jgi:hypothetical protein
MMPPNAMAEPHAAALRDVSGVTAVCAGGSTAGR